MAPSNIPYINVECVLAALAQLNVHLSEQQIAVFHHLNDGHASLTPHVAPTKTVPIIVVSDDETDAGASAPTYHTATTSTTKDTVDFTNSEDEDTKEPMSKYDLTCAICGTTFELVQRKSQPWYGVFVGCKVGIYQSYKKAMEQIDGVTEGVWLCYPTLKAAKSAYRDAQHREKVKVWYSKQEMLDMQDTAELERQKGVARGREIAIYYLSD